MTLCSEFVVYRIKNDDTETFKLVHARVQSDLKKIPGHVSLKTQIHITDPCLRIDCVTWENKEKAKAAYEIFKTLPSSKALMNLVDEVCFSGHFYDSLL